MKTKNMTTLHLRKSIGPATAARGLLLIPLALAWFALSPASLAQLPSPTPDGGYPNNNTAEGTDALFSLTTGSFNTAIGFEALLSNTTGTSNTANGWKALFSNTDGFNNTANGFEALLNNNGDNNTANGSHALQSNTIGGDNTANGFQALFSNTDGFNNTANGVDALLNNTSGFANTANGVEALGSNRTGDNDTANGAFALFSNTTGGNNTANGEAALEFNTTGSYNTANGFEVLFNNNAGSGNTANGAAALLNNNADNNTANGANALFSNTTGANNIALGLNAGKNLTTGSNNIDIGNVGVAGEANTIRIGKSGVQTTTFIAGIHGVAVTGAEVVVSSTGQLGVAPSSERFKAEIKPMDKASEAILALKPVTFHYKHELDPEGIPQFGLVAEEVAKVNPDLVARDNEGKPYSVRYEAVNAMLLNEFLKEHRKVQELKSTVAKQEAIAAEQQKQIKTLTSGLEKVNIQLELSKPAPQMA